MRLAWIGFHTEGLLALEALLKGAHPPEAVITLTVEELAKRSGGVGLDELCSRYKVALHKIRNINHAGSVQLLEDLSLDVAFVIGWSQIVRPEALRAVRVGMIGAHAALLPHNRGSAPINWAIIRGERYTGNTLIWLSEQVDEGHVIDQVRFDVTAYDTCGSLYEKVAQSNRDMILRLLPKLLAGQRPGRPQTPTDEPLLPRRRPGDGLVDWSQGGRQVYDFIRALTRPYPGAFAWLDGQRWRLWEAALLPADLPRCGTPGECLGSVRSPCDDACGQLVACGQGPVVLLEVESEDGRVVRGPALSELLWKGKTWSHEP